VRERDRERERVRERVSELEWKVDGVYVYDYMILGPNLRIFSFYLMH
jgi:hypothetical protein